MVMRWQPIPGFEPFEASELGGIRNSITLRAPSSRIHRGYVYVKVKGQSRQAHRLVLLAFRGLPPANAPETRHLNGNRQDNRIENLAWGNRQENMDDMAVHGTRAHGERGPGSKLTEQQAIEIIKSTATKHSLADIYGVTVAQIHLICVGRSWPHLKNIPRGKKPFEPRDVLRGENNCAAKLTWKAVEEIRASTKTTAELARRFGVTWRAVALVRAGESWTSKQGVLQ